MSEGLSEKERDREPEKQTDTDKQTDKHSGGRYFISLILNITVLFPVNISVDLYHSRIPLLLQMTRIAHHRVRSQTDVKVKGVDSCVGVIWIAVALAMDDFALG